MDIGRLDQAVVVLYFVATLILAAVLSRRVRSYDEFLVAGRRLSTPLLICTLVSTYYGLGVLLAGSEISYETGIVSFLFDTAPAYVLVLLMALFVAGRVRARVDGRSIPDLIDAHYGRAARVCASLACFVYALPVFSILGMGGLFALLFGLPFEAGMFLGTLITLVYTALGGLMAVAATDALQFVIMAVTLAVAGAIGVHEVGGVERMVEMLPEHFHPAGDRPTATLVIYALTSLSVLVEPAFYQRIFAAASPRAVVRALCLGIGLWIAYDWTITMLGIGARTAVEQGWMTDPQTAGQGADQAVTRFVVQVLPVGLTGLFAAGLAAAAMSTTDSYLLVCSSTLVYDLWQPARRVPMTDAQLVSRTRWMLCVAAAANVGLCLWMANVERLWIFMTAVLVCTCLVPVLAALYLPDLRRQAGAAAAVTGFGLISAYTLWLELFGEWVEAEGGDVWTGSIAGQEISLHQDHGMLYVLPVVVLLFVALQWLPRGHWPARGMAPKV